MVFEANAGIRRGASQLVRAPMPFMCLMLSLAQPARAQQHPLAPLVERYVGHYAAGEIDSLRDLLAAEVVFEDPVQTLEGRDAFIAGLTEAFEGFTITGFDRDRTLYSLGGEHVLLTGRIRFTIHAPGGDTALDVPFGLSLKVEAGKVVRHVDFVDAFEFSRQMSAGRPGAPDRSRR